MFFVSLDEVMHSCSCPSSVIWLEQFDGDTNEEFNQNDVDCKENEIDSMSNCISS